MGFWGKDLFFLGWGTYWLMGLIPYDFVYSSRQDTYFMDETMK